MNHSRRNFMKKAAMGTGLVWTTPVITSFAPPAAAAGTPPPVHRTSTTTNSLPDGRPHTANDCKNGGWERFGIFRNQGDCVSWLATHGKNEPGKNQPRR